MKKRTVFLLIFAVILSVFPVTAVSAELDAFPPVEIPDGQETVTVGDDVYTEISVTPWEAVLGTKINIDFLGETIGVYIPQGTTTGEEIKIPDKGYKNAR